jgi:hypothetical protein
VDVAAGEFVAEVTRELGALAGYEEEQLRHELPCTDSKRDERIFRWPMGTDCRIGAAAVGWKFNLLAALP